MLLVCLLCMFINIFVDSLGVVDIKIKKFHPNMKLKQKVFFLKIKGLNYITGLLIFWESIYAFKAFGISFS